jgi:hypothetical protein
VLRICSVERGDALLEAGVAFGRRDGQELFEHRAQPSPNHRMHRGFGDLVGTGGQEFVSAGSVEDDPRTACVVDDQPDREVAVRQG